MRKINLACLIFEINVSLGMMLGGSMGVVGSFMLLEYFSCRNKFMMNIELSQGNMSTPEKISHPMQPPYLLMKFIKYFVDGFFHFTGDVLAFGLRL